MTSRMFRLAFMSVHKNEIVIIRKRVDIRNFIFFRLSVHWFIDIIFTLQLISFTVHMWCSSSHGRFSSYFLYLSVFLTQECVLRKYHVLMCTQVIFSPSLCPKFTITWKNHLSCLISSIAWHFFSACQDTMHTWGTLENWVLIYKLATAPWPQNDFYFHRRKF